MFRLPPTSTLVEHGLFELLHGQSCVSNCLDCLIQFLPLSMTTQSNMPSAELACLTASWPLHGLFASSISLLKPGRTHSFDEGGASRKMCAIALHIKCISAIASSGWQTIPHELLDLHHMGPSFSSTSMFTLPILEALMSDQDKFVLIPTGHCLDTL